MVLYKIKYTQKIIFERSVVCCESYELAQTICKNQQSILQHYFYFLFYKVTKTIKCFTSINCLTEALTYVADYLPLNRECQFSHL